jgi:hypothetical protein
MQNRLWLKLAIYLEIGLGLTLLKIASPQTAYAQIPSSLPVEIAQISLQPFFDQVNNPEFHRFPSGKPADITPQPPYLNAFDQAVLRTCGTIGSKVKASDVKQLMLNNPSVLRRIQQAAGGELRANRRTQAQFLDDLTSVWSNKRGFQHIFCGEIKSKKGIGGLHFFGRYLQLQNQGIAGKLLNNQAKEEVIPGVVYTLGVVIQQGNRTVSDRTKGYALVSDAAEIFVDATKAFKSQGNKQGACLYPVRDQNSGKSYQAVFVKDRNSIVTFYPDATPKGKVCAVR